MDDELLPTNCIQYPDGTIEPGPCTNCKTPTRSILIVSFRGVDKYAEFYCRNCQEESTVEFNEYRKQFEELLAAGIDRLQANTIMIERINNTKVN